MAPDRVVVHRLGREFDRAKVPNALDRDEHGTAGYALGCRCRRCRSAARTAERVARAERALLAGREPVYWCSTAPMARHIAALCADGWTLKAIALAAGLNVAAFRRALRRGSTSSTTVAKVMRVR
jgi:hypothetical protein